MLVVDDILLSPVKGLIWVFKEMLNAAQQEIAGEAETITTRLSELYMMLETGSITEEEFDAQEMILLDRLDEIEEEQSGEINNVDGEDGE